MRAAAPPARHPPPSWAKWAPAVVSAGSVIILVLPVYLVSRVHVASEDATELSSAMAMVGLGVLFRAVARNLLRTSIGVVSRTASRAISRRWTRAMLRSATAFIRTATQDAKDGTDDEKARKKTQHVGLALGEGFIALAASYAGVVLLADEATRSALLGGVSLVAASCISAVPLFVYIGAAFSGGRWLGVAVTPQTAIDGLLLQAYFTFSGSFLPLTTDVSYEGEPKRCAGVAVLTLATLLGCHMVLWFVGAEVGSEPVMYLANAFLIFAFVVSFPFRPLDGHHLWSLSKALWALCFAPVALAFHYHLPKALYAII